jgi:hypothetical protein
MAEPATIIFSVKQALVGGAGLLGINLVGWKMFASVKLKQIDEHERRLKEIEANHISRAFLNDVAIQVNTKLDKVHSRIDRLYELQSNK